MRKAALHNLGCKVNSYETEAMTQLLKKAGYEIVSFQDQADVYIINTCSVTNMADRKSRQMLHKAKKQNPNAVVVATGCYVQTATEKVAQDLSIDLVVGNNRKKDIVEILNEYYAEKEAGEQVKEEYVIDINHTDEYEDLEISTVTEHTRAHLKIQDGCNNFCSYCIIPYARGRIRSRTMESIKAELERLSASGFKEIVLTGINLSCYDDNGKKLIDVIEMADNVNGIERIRLGSLDPEVVTEDFVERLGKVKKICPHFHFSLQSGCDKTLKAMNRHYTSDEYYEKCQLIRKYIDNPAFTTDVIVGFPGETEEDFEETMDRVCLQKLSQPDACLSVVVNRVPVDLPLNRISHFENRLHKVYATLTDGSVIPLSQKLSAILESVSEQEIFLRCHQSYIVNLAHVHTLEDSSFQMEDGTSIPISRAFYKEAKNAYYHYRLR